MSAENLTVQFGAEAAGLVGMVALLVQQLKRSPAIVKLQQTIPVYLIAALCFSIYGAHLLGITNPIYAGILLALSSGGAFDLVKKKEKGDQL